MGVLFFVFFFFFLALAFIAFMTVVFITFCIVVLNTAFSMVFPIAEGDVVLAATNYYSCSHWGYCLVSQCYAKYTGV